MKTPVAELTAETEPDEQSDDPEDGPYITSLFGKQVRMQPTQGGMAQRGPSPIALWARERGADGLADPGPSAVAGPRSSPHPTSLRLMRASSATLPTRVAHWALAAGTRKPTLLINHSKRRLAPAREAARLRTTLGGADPPNLNPAQVP